MPFCFFLISTSPICNYKILNPKNPGQIPFVLITIKNNGLRGESMAKSSESVKKRKKELARKEKKDQKRQLKMEKKTIKAEENPSQLQNEGENL
jgi:hypothetical protein